MTLKAYRFIYYPILTFCFFINLHTQAQNQGFLRRYFNKILFDTTDAAQPQFLVYPTLAYAPETSWEIGFSSLYVYHAKKDTLNRLSEVSGFTFFTLENQYGFWFDHALYSDQDRYFLLGRLRFQSFPLYYHGIGPDTPEDYLALVNANQIQIKERFLRNVSGNFFIGLEADFQRFSQVDFKLDPEVGNIEMPRGNNGSTNLGLGLGLIYDNRHNVLNVREGIFSEIAYLHYDKVYGSDFTFSTIISDNRFFKKVRKNNVIAAQLLGQFTGGDVPFNQLALLGGESIMRGYYYGRYRDNNQVAFQLEYRMLPLKLGFTDRLGAAVFASAGKVFPEIEQFSTDDLLFSGGAGLRYLLFAKKDIFTRFDVALTREGPGFYLFIGEAF